MSMEGPGSLASLGTGPGLTRLGIKSEPTAPETDTLTIRPSELYVYLNEMLVYLV